MVEVKVPSVGESISEVQISKWLKKEGDYVESGTDLVELETEKASVQIPAPISGILSKIVTAKDVFASVGDILCLMEPSEKGAESPSSSENAPSAAIATPHSSEAAKRVMPAAARMLADNQLSADQVAASGSWWSAS